MTITVSSIVVRQLHVVEQLLPNEAVLLVPTRGEVKVLNDVGARIWISIDGTRSVGEIAAEICAEYAVERAQAEHDAITFIHELAQRNLILIP